MMRVDRDALLCDMAETYRIYNIYELDPFTIARLAAGLRGDSRIRSRLAGFEEPLTVVLLAAITDRLTAICAPGKKLKFSFVDSLTIKQEKEPDITGFNSVNTFMEAREKAMQQFRG